MVTYIGLARVAIHRSRLRVSQALSGRGLSEVGPEFMECWEGMTKEIAEVEWSRVVVLGGGGLEDIAAEGGIGFC